MKREVAKPKRSTRKLLQYLGVKDVAPLFDHFAGRSWHQSSLYNTPSDSNYKAWTNCPTTAIMSITSHPVARSHAED